MSEELLVGIAAIFLAIAMFLFFKWMSVIANVKGLRGNAVFNYGYYRPKYISKNNYKIEENDRARLNKINGIMNGALICGIILIAIALVLF